ncbi:MAG: hypothetical protein D6698_01635 [Gammaproteobacteria bacterium]|nr:MAG: hypothetical protein D6698_01635 [Gammaproteobacteria bacterium]
MARTSITTRLQIQSVKNGKGKYINLETGTPGTFYTKLHIKPGVYEAELAIYDRDGYEVVYLNKATPIIPRTNTDIKNLIEAVLPKNRARAIIRQLGRRTSNPDQALQLLRDKSFLTSIRGIRDKTADKLLEKLQILSEETISIYTSLRYWNIPFSPSNARGTYLIELTKKAPHVPSLIKENPYVLPRLTEEFLGVSRISSVSRRLYGFSEVDKAILQKDPEWANRRERIETAVFSAISSTYDDGDTLVSYEAIARKLRKHKVPVPSFIDLIEMAQADKELKVVRVEDSQGHTLCHFCLNQTYLRTRKILEVLRHPYHPGFPDRKIIEERAFATAPFELTPEQKQSILHAIEFPISIITGGAGTGKTTVSQCILNGFAHLLHSHKRQTAYNIYVLATTGAASQRLRQGLTISDPLTETPVAPLPIPTDTPETKHLSSGKLYLGTLHAFLGYRGGSYYLGRNPHPSIVFVDEFSMADEEVAYELFKYVRSCYAAGAPVVLILCGDDGQLPPVGPGFPFRDLLATSSGGILPVSRLTITQRQAEKNSRIVQVGNMIRHGQIPPLSKEEEAYTTDFWWSGQEASGSIVDLVDAYIKFLTHREKRKVLPNEIQIILPLRNQSKIEETYHTNDVNRTLQQYYARKYRRLIEKVVVASPDNPDEQFVSHFAAGDRVIHMGTNGYTCGNHEPVMRGSVGTVSLVRPDQIRVKYPWMEQEVLYATPEDIYGLQLAYAITGHSSQGNEYDYVLTIIPSRAAPTILDSSWLYTVVMRTRRHILLVARPERIARIVSTNFGRNRQTLLSHLLAS